MRATPDPDGARGPAPALRIDLFERGYETGAWSTLGFIHKTSQWSLAGFLLGDYRGALVGSGKAARGG